MQTGSVSNLVSDIGASVTDVSVHLTHNTNVFIAVEERVLLLALRTHAAGAVRGLVGLEAGIGEHHDEPLGVLVGRRDGHVLLCDELGEGRRRERLGACHGYVVVRHVESVSS